MINIQRFTCVKVEVGSTIGSSQACFSGQARIPAAEVAGGPLANRPTLLVSLVNTPKLFLIKGKKCPNCEMLFTRNLAAYCSEECGRACRRRRERENPTSKVVKASARRINQTCPPGYEPPRELLGCTGLELRNRLESLFKPRMTWANYGKWHIDHIKPVASFDLSKAEDRRACFHYTNLQPLWAAENRRKSCHLES